MSKVVTEEYIKTLRFIGKLINNEIEANFISEPFLDRVNRLPHFVRELMAKGEPYCFENEGEIPFIESPYNWELRTPNKKALYAFKKFDLPITFKSYLKYLDEFTQRGFKFYIQYNSNEFLAFSVDDLELDEYEMEQVFFKAKYINEEKDIDYCIKCTLEDSRIICEFQTGKNHSYTTQYRKSIELTDEIKNKYGIEVADRPLPY